MNEITSVTEKGIHYLDDEGKSQFIDFEACYQKFLADTRKSMGARFTDKEEEFYKTWKSVGVRHALSKPQTLRFFTVPPIDFVFTAEDPFWQVLVGIKKAGYRTTDGD